jgi:hypothetical protein
MTPAPSVPRAVERIGELLVPPSVAEHVLGDLAETSPTAGQYIRRLASVLPHVVWSQIRRRVTVGGLIFNMLFSGFFLILFQRIPRETFLHEPSAWGRMLVLLLIWVIGNALSAAYGPLAKPGSWHRGIFFTTAALVLGTAAVLGVPVPGVGIALAVIYGVTLLLAMPWVTQNAPPPLSVDTLPQHARFFQRAIWWRNLREAAGAAVVLGVNVPDLFRLDDPVKWTGHLLLVLGTLFIVGYLFTRAGTRRVPDQVDSPALLSFHRGELLRQRNILLAVPLWYLLPFAPGMLVTMASKGQTSIGSALAGLIVVSVMFIAVWRLNLWAASFLDKQLAEVSSLDDGCRG